MMYKEYINSDGLKIQLPIAIWQNIVENINKFYPNECGGILIGSINTDTSTAAIEQMYVPPKVDSTPVFLRRFATGLNKLLKGLFNRTSGKQYYLGEWHSHPNAAPIPSSTDIAAMERVASNKNIKIRTPLLLIVSAYGTVFHEKFYIFFNNKLISYEQQ